MLLSPSKNGLTSLNKEVRVFKVCPQNHSGNTSKMVFILFLVLCYCKMGASRKSRFFALGRIYLKKRFFFKVKISSFKVGIWAFKVQTLKAQMPLRSPS